MGRIISESLSGAYTDSTGLDQASLGMKRFWCRIYYFFPSDVSLHPREKMHWHGVITLIGLILCRCRLGADESWGRGGCLCSAHTQWHTQDTRGCRCRAAFRHHVFPRGLLQNLQTIKKPHQTAFLPFKLHDRSQSAVLKPSWELLGCNGESSLGESPATSNFQVFQLMETREENLGGGVGLLSSG